MAKALVNSLASEWDAEKYTDKYRANLLRIIHGKVKGKDVELEPTTEAPRGEVVDLMERLRRSLDQSARKGRTGRKRTPSRKRSRRAA
jgi:DNA end-binding protein Ku